LHLEQVAVIADDSLGAETLAQGRDQRWPRLGQSHDVAARVAQIERQVADLRDHAAAENSDLYQRRVRHRSALARSDNRASTSSR
jgi:hypothetical protein